MIRLDVAVKTLARYSTFRRSCSASSTCASHTRIKDDAEGKDDRPNVHVIHAAPQAGLHAIGVPLEQPHDAGPAQRREGDPAVVADGLARVGPAVQQAPAVARGRVHAVVAEGDVRLHGQLRGGQAHAREHVDHDLLRHRAVDAAPEHHVAAQQARHERVVRVHLAGVDARQRQHRGFVHQREVGEVACVLPCCFEDERDLFPEWSVAEEEDHAGGFDDVSKVFSFSVLTSIPSNLAGLPVFVGGEKISQLTPARAGTESCFHRQCHCACP